MPRGRPRTAECGSNTAYCRHIKNKETPCDPCKEAHAKFMMVERRGKAIRTGLGWPTIRGTKIHVI